MPMRPRSTLLLGAFHAGIENASETIHRWRLGISELPWAVRWARCFGELGARVATRAAGRRVGRSLTRP